MPSHLSQQVWEFLSEPTFNKDFTGELENFVASKVKGFCGWNVHWGLNQPFEKYAQVKLDHLPRDQGENKKMSFETTT